MPSSTTEPRLLESAALVPVFGFSQLPLAERAAYLSCDSLQMMISEVKQAADWTKDTARLAGVTLPNKQASPWSTAWASLARSQPRSPHSSLN